MRSVILFLAFALLSACVTADSEMTLTPVADAQDPEWIQKLDREAVAEGNEILARFDRTTYEKIALYESLACISRTFIAKARATEALARSDGITRVAASKQIDADPLWIMASEQC